LRWKIKKLIVILIFLILLIACTSNCDEEISDRTITDKKVNEITDNNVPKDDAKLWKEDQIARHDKYPALVY
tara:strand:+ start:2297 stop:2512 length:216 start_codon:yes stop_codon:yes gene_type:complete